MSVESSLKRSEHQWQTAEEDLLASLPQTPPKRGGSRWEGLAKKFQTSPDAVKTRFYIVNRKGRVRRRWADKDKQRVSSLPRGTSTEELKAIAAETEHTFQAVRNRYYKLNKKPRLRHKWTSEEDEFIRGLSGSLSRDQWAEIGEQLGVNPNAARNRHQKINAQSLSNQQMVTLVEFAQMIGFSEAAVRKWLKDGELDSYGIQKMGPFNMFTRETVNQWLENNSHRRGQIQLMNWKFQNWAAQDNIGIFTRDPDYRDLKLEIADGERLEEREKRLRTTFGRARGFFLSPAFLSQQAFDSTAADSVQLLDATIQSLKSKMVDPRQLNHIVAEGAGVGVQLNVFPQAVRYLELFYQNLGDFVPASYLSQSVNGAKGFRVVTQTINFLGELGEQLLWRTKVRLESRTASSNEDPLEVYFILNTL